MWQEWKLEIRCYSLGKKRWWPTLGWLQCWLWEVVTFKYILKVQPTWSADGFHGMYKQRVRNSFIILAWKIGWTMPPFTDTKAQGEAGLGWLLSSERLFKYMCLEYREESTTQENKFVNHQYMINCFLLIWMESLRGMNVFRGRRWRVNSWPGTGFIKETKISEEIVCRNMGSKV